ncbi:MAG TPA: hypothetical protein PK264_16250, partial [Hyphomicrobiaceae bacterium]|nr:hypothetical protein [Hyphomicrobiaceae bacterium]
MLRPFVAFIAPVLLGSATLAGLAPEALARSDSVPPRGPNGPPSAGPVKGATTAPDFRGIRGHVLVESIPAGYRRYARRTNLAYKGGEQIVLYGEPIGFGWSAVVNGQQLHMVVNIEIVDQTGAVVFKPEDVTLRQTEATMPAEPFVHVAFVLPTLKPGEYAVHYKFHDRANKKMVRFHRSI